MQQIKLTYGRELNPQYNSKVVKCSKDNHKRLPTLHILRLLEGQGLPTFIALSVNATYPRL